MIQKFFHDVIILNLNIERRCVGTVGVGTIPQAPQLSFLEAIFFSFFLPLMTLLFHFKLRLWVVISVTHRGGCVLLAGAGEGRQRLAGHC